MRHKHGNGKLSDLSNREAYPRVITNRNVALRLACTNASAASWRWRASLSRRAYVCSSVARWSSSARSERAAASALARRTAAERSVASARLG